MFPSLPRRVSVSGHGMTQLALNTNEGRPITAPNSMESEEFTRGDRGPNTRHTRVHMGLSKSEAYHACAQSMSNDSMCLGIRWRVTSMASTWQPVHGSASAPTHWIRMPLLIPCDVQCRNGRIIRGNGRRLCALLLWRGSARAQRHSCKSTVAWLVLSSGNTPRRQSVLEPMGISGVQVKSLDNRMSHQAALQD